MFYKRQKYSSSHFLIKKILFLPPFPVVLLNQTKQLPKWSFINEDGLPVLQSP